MLKTILITSFLVFYVCWMIYEFTHPLDKDEDQVSKDKEN